MSIANEISRLQTAKSKLKDSINNKLVGSYRITNQTLDQYYNYVDAIQTGGGVTPDGWIPMEVTLGSSFGKQEQSFTYTVPNGARVLKNSCFQYGFYYSGITSFDFNNVTEIGYWSCAYMCSQCSYLTSVDVSSITRIGYEGFLRAFESCWNLTSLSFDGLTVNSFGNNTNCFDHMLSGTSGCTVHFPIQIKPVIENWNSVKQKFSANACTILFDLHATELNFTITPASYMLWVNGTILNPNTSILVDPYASNNYLIQDDNLNVIYYRELTGLTENTTVPITVNLNNVNTNKISLSTGISGITGTVTVGGQTFNLVEETSGVLVTNVDVPNGTSISYYINGGDTYSDVSGTITTTGSDISETITMTPAVMVTFTRPDLTANGTMGGNAFAVEAGSEYSSTNAAWKAVDNSATTYWRGATTLTTQEYTFYNPNALKVSQLDLILYSTGTAYQAGAITVYGSNDGTSWTGIMTDPKPSATAVNRTITVNSSSFYKYYKMEFLRYGTTGAVGIKDIGITAVYKQ